MKNIFRLTLIAVCILISGCSETNKIKDKIDSSIRDTMKIMLEKECEEYIKGHVHLKDILVNKILDRTEVEILDLEVEEGRAEANVKVKSIPSIVRKETMVIINRFNENKQENFNVPDGINLVYQKHNIEPGTLSSESYKVILKKDPSGWSLEKIESN